MKEGIIVILALVLTASAIHLNLNHDAAVDLPAGTVYLGAYNGQYARICANCGPAAYTDSAALGPTRSAWTLEVVGSQVAFKGNTGKYLARCNKCWSRATKQDAVFVHATGLQPSALWTPILQANGLYSFKGDNGKFLTTCNKCVGDGTVPDFLFASELGSLSPYSQWNVAYANFPNLGTKNIKADNGGFLRLCTNCGPSNAVSVDFNNDLNAKWILSRVGTKLVIKSYTNGNYLSRCNGCWLGGTSPDAAFARLKTPNEAYSQWTPTQVSSGKFTIQADTGKYLARCNGCATSPVPNLAFVNGVDPTVASAQFVIV